MLASLLAYIGRVSMHVESFKESTWRDSTRDLLNNRPAHLSISKVAEACNVSEAWLRLFARGQIENPGVATVECLHNFLKEFKAE